MKTNFCCRSCQSLEHAPVLDLCTQPLANGLLKTVELARCEPKIPLRLALCKKCWLLQLVELVPPASLFSEYLYFSSFSEALLRHARVSASRYQQLFALGEESLVVEIASNDGYLLKNFVAAGIPCLGIEPAANIAAVSKAAGIQTLVEFFNERLANELAAAGQKADLILGNNVFAHVPDTNDFVAGLERLLKPQGRVVLEFPYAVDMVEKTEFDTIYHEHVFYFTLTPVLPLFARHGLEIVHVERIPIHGGSLRLFAAHKGAFPVEASVPALLAEEERRGVGSLEYYRDFSSRVEAIKSALVDLLQKLKSEGNRLAAYGASAKGSTLLNYAGIANELLDFVVDRNTYKQGCLTPGSHIPIVPPEKLLEHQPDYTLLLTWNFAEEIFAQQAEYRRRGGRFIVPIPDVRVV